ncbi:PepSY domain-containing protein [Virgibacillus sp. NKC19-3]|uniref:PepSY domain-containing protein n=1 Tax=Virgibacillus saliphilus TaxID=2831674 RepID=UPI001C9A5FF8|nr:PepSY domain-containing protein [Virgibacillus sp. NKC19-3]MBY7144910.1 PepSY domain-containing protein [Virgibacillus sp. NKC19-3]
MYHYWGPTGYPNWQHQGYGYRENWNRQINMIEGINIALQQVPGEVVSAELDTKNNTQIYEVEIVTQQGAKYEVDVDRSTGNILSIDLD